MQTFVVPEMGPSTAWLFEVCVSRMGPLRPVCHHWPEYLAESSCQHSCLHHRHRCSWHPTFLHLSASLQLHLVSRKQQLNPLVTLGFLRTKIAGLESLTVVCCPFTGIHRSDPPSEPRMLRWPLPTPWSKRTKEILLPVSPGTGR